MVIATKLFFGDGNGDGRNTTKLSRKAIFHQIEESLKRLGTDYIDILYIHRWDYDTPIEETMSALNDLVRSGKVLYLGASAMYARQFQKAQYIAEKNGWTKFSVMQNHYHLLYREDEREMIPFCKDSDVTQKEIAAVVTQVAFYTGWPKAWAVFNLAKEIWKEG